MDNIPNWSQTMNGVYEWENDNNGIIIAVIYDDYDEQWIATGQNSLIGTAETEEDAASIAIEYMMETPNPSSMLG